MLSIEEVKKIADLARIQLTEEEVSKYQKDLSSILDYVEELKQVNTENLEIVSQVTGLENVMRKDETFVLDSEEIEKITIQAPETKDGYYKVKAIL